MKYEILKPQESDYDIMIEIWERSVRRTHDFIPEEYIIELKKDIREKYFYNVSLLIVKVKGEIKAFIGISWDVIEMLFVDADEMWKWYGSILLNFVIGNYWITKVDVNEQNVKALEFYLKNWFKIISRDEHDNKWNPYPILHLSL